YAFRAHAGSDLRQSFPAALSISHPARLSPQVSVHAVVEDSRWAAADPSSQTGAGLKASRRSTPTASLLQATSSSYPLRTREHRHVSESVSFGCVAEEHRCRRGRRGTRGVRDRLGTCGQGRRRLVAGGPRRSAASTGWRVAASRWSRSPEKLRT